MTTPETFNFRRALPSDREAVSALCAKIWDGDDYVPRCFDAWAADQAGEFTLCFAGGHLAGVSKLTWLVPGTAWLEGLRKDPDLPVKGVGTALCRRYLQRLAHAEGLEHVRFSTYFANHASIRLNEALGFEHIATASKKYIGPEILGKRRLETGPADPRVEVVRNGELVFPFIRASGWFGPFIHQSWRSYAWSEAFFRERYLDRGHCLGILADERLKALGAACIEPFKGVGALPFFDAEDLDSAAILLAAVERRFALEGVAEADAIVPRGTERALRLLDTLGWKSEEQEEDYVLYELPLEKLAAYR
ncbi:MAG TPA: GNAT family N-acetyltransferase [Holophaga sp.]|nr:GNAT family N-acetyltransferase [Holophaga sp.]HPS68760.1 GNAT family N-acetyltransferase [Holophaga sp.]